MVLLRKKVEGKNRVCDGRCYRASGTSCNCICKANCHGKGLQAAIEYITAHYSEFETAGIEVVVEDRLLFDTDPAKTNFDDDNIYNWLLFLIIMESMGKGKD